MAVATWQDVQTALGSLIPNTAEQQQVTHWLDGLELLIAGRFGVLTDLDQAALKYVESEAIAAKVDAFRRRQRESSITVTADEGSVTRRYEVSASDVTDELWSMLSPTVTASAYTVAVSSPLDLP